MSSEYPSRDQLYGRRWRKASREFLVEHPLCVMCAAMDKLTSATVVDHIRPHRNDPAVFWDVANWQPLCQMHHDVTKQRQERTGEITGCDANGVPINPEHPWHEKNNQAQDRGEC